MRVVITGAQGVGKTTLATELGKHYPQFKILPEAARLALEAGLKLDHTATPETEMWLIEKQIELESTDSKWIADRSCIDLLAYINYLFSHETELIEFAHKILVPKISNYDLVIYLPAGEFEIVDDGVRTTDHKFQKDIDRHILNILNDHKIPFVKVIGTTEERIARVKELLV